MKGTAHALRNCVFDVKSLLSPIRKTGMSGGILAGYFPAGQLFILAAMRNMVAKQGKGDKTLIRELLEKAVSRAV
jgi:hypothetical protein